MTIVLATGNRDKIREITAIMSGIDVELMGPDDFENWPEVVEDRDTLEANALKKAREIRAFTGMSALADDTGLEVDALDGAPGVYSSRFAGDNVTYDDNNRKLLAELEGVPPDKRAARFRCVMALALVNKDAQVLYDRLSSGGVVRTDDGAPDALVTEGILTGRIAGAKRGSSGFGFDPLFEVGDSGQTLAEMGLEAKNRISHRYRALVEMRELLLRTGMAVEK
jgi:XTP/dITP diphosphohydrolase